MTRSEAIKNIENFIKFSIMLTAEPIMYMAGQKYAKKSLDFLTKSDTSKVEITFCDGSKYSVDAEGIKGLIIGDDKSLVIKTRNGGKIPLKADEYRSVRYAKAND